MTAAPAAKTENKTPLRKSLRHFFSTRRSCHCTIFYSYHIASSLLIIHRFIFNMKNNEAKISPTCHKNFIYTKCLSFSCFGAILSACAKQPLRAVGNGGITIDARPGMRIPGLVGLCKNIQTHGPEYLSGPCVLIKFCASKTPIFKCGDTDAPVKI